MLIGRARELAALIELLRAAAEGRGGALVLRGEAGLGKTALLEEAARAAGEFSVLRAAGFEAEAELPYAAIHQLLQPLLPAVDGLAERQAAALRAAFGLDGESPNDRLLVGLAILTLLAQAADERPVLCLIDDAQWIDRESLDALAFVARRIPSERVAVVAAVREGADARVSLPNVRELSLLPLGRTDAAALLAARHGDRLGARGDEVLMTAAGNPLALVELADAAVRGAASITSVEQTFLDALRRLPPETQTLLLLAAADEQAPTATIAEAADALQVDVAALDSAERAGLVHVELETIHFKHPLARAAAYNAASFTERREAHAALAQVLTREEDVDRHAWHRAAATIGGDEDVARLLENSAARATARSGDAAAATALERAARLSTDEARRARRLVRAAAAACVAGQRSRALTLLDEAEKAVADPRLHVEAAHIRGVIEMEQGSPALAMRIFLDAATTAFPLDRHETLNLVTHAQEAAGLAGAHDAVLEFASWAERLGPGETVEEEIMLGLTHGFAAIASGDRAGAAPALARAAERGRGVEEPRLLVWAATAAMFLGDDPQVLELLRKAVQRARSRGAAGSLPFALHLLAGAERRLGDLAGAEADADESYRLALETGQLAVAAGALSTLTALAAFRGDVDTAERLAAETRGLANPRGLRVALVGVTRALAELDLARGNAAAALTALMDEFGGSDERVRNHPYTMFTAPLLFEAASRAGQPEAAAPYLTAFEQWVAAGRLHWAEPLLARGRALLAREHDEAEKWFDRALALHRRAPQAYEMARTQLLYGELLRRARRKTEARAQLRAAHETFESAGARLWAERALGELRATGATARKRDDSTRGDLTPQELQIVRLVALGKTNPEVAAQLFVSPKTVQYHLRKVFGKLGIASRNELTRLVAQGEIAGAATTADAA